MNHASLKFIFVSVLLVQCAHSAETAKKEAGTDSKPAEKLEEMVQPPVTKEAKVTIGGQVIPYTVTTSKMIIRDDEGKAKASIFNVSYTRNLVKDISKRPVMFAFNGGPGSSAVWLHLGILGPKRIEFPGDGTSPVEPPARLIDNAHSLLDVCDLVFIDPVSTGYSRVEKDVKAKDFHGLQADIESVGDFIRIWITQNKRWSSPKYLCGESYGGIRAAGLSNHLQDRYGMNLNGVVLLSSLLDFRTIIPSQGSQLSHQIYLPAYATTARYHQKVEGELDTILAAAREFAFGDYSAALLAGNELSDEKKQAIAEKLASLTGITSEIWLKKQLRLDPFEFRAELLRAEGKVIGRFDARVAWDAADPDSNFAEYDPSYTLALGAFSTAMLGYLGDELGWKEDQPYEILTSKVSPWNYGSDNQIVNMADKMAGAIRDNPKLKVLVMGAYADLATPADGVPYSFRQVTNFPPNLKNRIRYTYYQAGHMFYLNPPDLIKARADLLEFLQPEK
ncbi:MAG: peptidase S10 [Armatimonadetes bacterium]|nr:peptidase S10 [Akkermansiaceae bacterium]